MCRTDLPVCLDLPDGAWSFHHLSTTVLGDVFLCQECKNNPVWSVKSVHDLSVQGTMLLRTVHIYKYFFINSSLTFKRWGLLLIISLQAVPKAVLHIREMTIAAGDPHIHVRAVVVPPSVQPIILCLPLFVDRPTSSTLNLGETVNPLENSVLGNTYCLLLIHRLQWVSKACSHQQQKVAIKVYFHGG